MLLFAAGAMALWAQKDPIPPRPPLAPRPPKTFDLPDFPRLDDLEFKLAQLEDRRFQLDDARFARLGRLHEDISARVSARVADAMSRVNTKLPRLMAPQAIFHASTDHERSYEAGIRALDGRRYERALEAFSQAAMTSGSRTDGALFWKAYTLHRLGRRDETSAALSELRKSHAASRWMGDAQALEAEMKQTAGQTREQLDAAEDFKVLALSGLAQSDPEKAAPLVEQILKGSPYRKLQDEALRSLVNGDSQRSRDLLAQIARGKVGDPDLQLRAIRYLGHRRSDNRQLLREIYTSATDEHVKRATVRALGSAEDTEQLLRIVKSDKDSSIRIEALSALPSSASSAELWPLYQAETSVEVKERILHRLKDLGGTERLVEVAKTEKEPKLRQFAIHALGSVTTGDTLVSLYAAETDQSVKRTIVDALYTHKNGKSLVDLARKEKDPEMRREIVRRLSRMHTKEASDYMAEILK
jgi:hypothetical protein